MLFRRLMACLAVCGFVLAASIPGAHAAPPPSAPAVNAGVPGAGTVTLTWSYPAGVADRFEISYRAANTAGWSVPAVVAGDRRSVTVGGLANGTVYRTHVRAVVGERSGVWSPQVSIRPVLAMPVMSAPAAGPGAATFSWSYQAGAANRFEVSYRMANTEAWSAPVVVPGDRRSVTIEGLSNGKVYRAYVRAVDGASKSVWSAQVSASPIADGPPVDTVDAQPGSAVVSWPASIVSPRPTRMLPAGGYYLLEEAAFGFGLGGGDSARLFQADGSTLVDGYTWPSGHASTTYGRCANGWGGFATTIAPTKGAANSCTSGVQDVRINEVESNGGTPGDWVELVNTGAAAVDISGLVFKDSDDAHGYAIPSATVLPAGGYYLLEEAAFGFGLGSGDSARLYKADGSTLVDGYTWPSGHASTTYGRCANGWGAFAATIAPTKGAANDCPGTAGIQDVRINEVESNGGTPGDWVELVNTGAAAVDISGLVFKDNEDAHGYVIPASSAVEPAHYEVSYVASGGAQWSAPVPVAADLTQLKVGELTPGKQYRFRVRAVVNGVPSRWTETPRATPTAVTIPSVPALSVRLTGARTGLDVGWSVASDGGRRVTGVQVSMRRVVDTVWTNLTPSTGSTTTLSSLTPGTAYYVRARATNAVGSSAWSAAVKRVVPQTTLPVMTINTADYAPVVSKDDYLDGSYSLDPNGSSFAARSGGIQIKGRGNSTWGLTKKPYKLKLAGSASLLGMPSSSHWVLLADYLDRSFVRNKTAFYLGTKTGLAWTPRSEWVEVVLNGQYLGLYELAEHVRIDPARVAIDELSASTTEAPAISGGYLLQRDARFDPATQAGFRTSRNQPFTLSEPDPVTAPQLAYIKDYFTATEDALFSNSFADPATGYAKYVDVPSFVDWYLVEELMRNNDAWYSSAYMYKPRSGKIFMGPLWDFDLSMGTTRAAHPNPPEGWWVRQPTTSRWFARFFEDADFQEAVEARWSELEPAFATAASKIDGWREVLRTAAANDQLVWGYTTEPFDTQVTGVRSWFDQRVEWITAELDD